MSSAMISTLRIRFAEASIREAKITIPAEVVPYVDEFIGDLFSEGILVDNGDGTVFSTVEDFHLTGFAVTKVFEIPSEPLRDLLWANRKFGIQGDGFYSVTALDLAGAMNTLVAALLEKVVLRSLDSGE